MTQVVGRWDRSDAAGWGRRGLMGGVVWGAEAGGGLGHELDRTGSLRSSVKGWIVAGGVSIRASYYNTMGGLANPLPLGWHPVRQPCLAPGATGDSGSGDGRDGRGGGVGFLHVLSQPPLPW